MNLARQLDDILTADPGRIVLRSSVRKWTSAEFDEVTRSVAGGLARRGVGKGDVVELRTDVFFLEQKIDETELDYATLLG